MKIAAIIDGTTLQRFALEALDKLEGTDEVTIFSCSNTYRRKRWLRHGAYYALNLITLRNRLTAMVPVRSTRKRVAAWHDFECEYEGAWQVLPPKVIAAMQEGKFDIVLKFGMGLMRVPAAEQLTTPILSFHHGDPDRYRGRPAGFWEMVSGERVMGQIIQVISDRLDAGRVVAYAETKIYPWSYRRTLIEAFRHSPLLINFAVRNAVGGRFISKSRGGRNWRLPSNLAVAAFVGRMSFRWAQRLLYGAAVEKRWRVGRAPVVAEELDRVLAGHAFPPPDTWRSIAPPKGYSFVADPFYSGRPGEIFVEALNSRSALGEIMSVNEHGCRTVLRESGHLSYPGLVQVGGRRFIVPESAGWSPPRVYQVGSGELALSHLLTVEGCERITDPTLFEHCGRLYLFGNASDLGAGALQLWSSGDLREPFARHPCSPIRISPQGSRMGGSLLRNGSRLIRFGQDYSSGYGEGVIAFEITDLCATRYAERAIGRIAFLDRKGPHTINFGPGEILFDWYVEELSPWAGVRRLIALARRRHPSRDGGLLGAPRRPLGTPQSGRAPRGNGG